MQKKLFLSLVAVLVAGIFCSCSAGEYKGLEKPLSGAMPEENTVSDGGLAARQGDWIYYINGDNFMRHENERFHEYAGALCRMRADGTEKDVVVDRDVSVFNIKGETIYLCVYDKGSSYISTANIDGSGYRVLKRIDDIYYGGCYGYTGDGIYFTEDFKLYCMDRDGTNIRRITDFAVYNLRTGPEYTYFTRELDGKIGNVYKVENGKNEYTEVTAGAAYVLKIDREYMYYYMLGNGNVYRYDQKTFSAEAVIYGGYTEYVFPESEDFYGVSYGVSEEEEESEETGIFVIPSGGGQKLQISKNCGSCMAYYDGYIYYINDSKLNYLYRAAIDGSSDECVMEDYIYDIDTLDVVDQWLYFFSAGDSDRVYRLNMEDLYIECVELEDIAIVG